jgi:Tfp pilus assembly protein PilV
MSMHKKNEAGFSTTEILLVLIIVALIGIIGLMTYIHNDKTVSATAASTNNSASSQSSDETSQTTAINMIINKGDYQGLVAYMSNSVKVVKEGTDAGGAYYSSAAAAATISDFYSKSNGAELPWDFTGDGGYKSDAAKSTGAVKEYVMQGNIAVSKNDWVLGYNLNSDQKITSFYMSPSVNMSK